MNNALCALTLWTNTLAASEDCESTRCDFESLRFDEIRRGILRWRLRWSLLTEALLQNVAGERIVFAVDRISLSLPKGAHSHLRLSLQDRKAGNFEQAERK
jgi:hypothetical protein